MRSVPGALPPRISNLTSSHVAVPEAKPVSTCPSDPDAHLEAERSPVGGLCDSIPGTIETSPTPSRPPGEIGPKTCPICGAPLTGRKTSACSDRCRAAKSRRARIPVKAAELREMRALLQTGLESLWEAKVRLEKYEGR